MNALSRVVRTVSVFRPISAMSSSGAISQPFMNTRRHFVKIGDTVDITFVKDEKKPVIREDKEYPDWVFQLSEKMPSKAALLEQLGPNAENLDDLSIEHSMRLKRLIRCTTIKDNNAASLTDN